MCSKINGHFDLERELFVVTVRAFIQLIAIGYVLELLIEQDRPLWVIFILLVMSIAGLTGLTCALLGYRQFFTAAHQLNLAVVLEDKG